MTLMYKVRIGYDYYTFTDITEAVDFAMTAFRTKDSKSDEVSITLINIEEEE